MTSVVQAGKARPKKKSPAGGVRRRGPSPEKTAATRREIVAAGLDLFLENGFSETRMVDVAARAGVAKGTLYLYFADKQALFEAIMRTVIGTPVADAMGRGPEADESVRAFIQRVLVPFMRDMESSKRAAVIRLVLAEAGRFPALAEAYDRLVLSPVIALARRLAEEAYKRGEIRSDAPVRFPQLVIAPGLVAAVWNGLHKGSSQIDAGALFEAHLDLLFGPDGTTV